VPLQHRGRGAFHVFALPDVAELVLDVELSGERAKRILAPRQQNEFPSLPCESARDRLADSARSAGDDGQAVYRQALSCRKGTAM
jgi:hypothetical protein